MKALQLDKVLPLLLLIQISRADPLDTWTSPNQLPTRTGVNRVVYGGGQFVAVGNGGMLMTSTDAVSWVQRQSGTTNFLADIAYGAGQFVAVGSWYEDVIRAGEVTIVTSTDGINWDLRQSGRRMYTLESIDYGNGKFIGASRVIDRFGNVFLKILTSTDGVNWAQHEPGTDVPLRRITYGNGQFVGVGGIGGEDSTHYSTIVTSADAVNWVQRESRTTNIVLTDVAYGKGQFVAVGGHRCGSSCSGFSDGTIVTSADGVNWVLRSSGGRVGLRAIAYGGGEFVAMGDNGYALTSSDGINWLPRNLLSWGLRPGSNAITYGNGHFVVVGSQGTILESGSIVTLSLLRDSRIGALSLSLEGPVGLDYTIQSSADLISWRNVTGITGAQFSKIILDGLPATAERVFYRAYSP